MGAAAPITLVVRSSDLALAEAQRLSCHRRATPMFTMNSRVLVTAAVARLRGMRRVAP